MTSVLKSAKLIELLTDCLSERKDVVGNLLEIFRDICTMTNYVNHPKISKSID